MPRFGQLMAAGYPRRLGKYVLLKPLARGGMGETYVAATGEPGFQKFCVIKKVLAEKTDRGKAKRFLDEAKVVLRLSHANLVPTLDAGEVDGEFFIAMELVEGKDLREIWNRCVRTRTRIPLDVALHVGREIARALAYVHSYGELHLVHRDVAPPNILLSYFGEVKLTDFGLARSVLKQEHTAPGVVFGRASYLAPEQARGEVADARTDIYSLGIVIWELLTGHQYLQLNNLDAATAMSLVRHPRPQPPSAKAPWIAPELDAAIMRALAPEREQRFQSAEEMRQALSEVIARTSPRADAERAAEFLRALYGAGIREEREERERLLTESAGVPAALASNADGEHATELRPWSAETPEPLPAPLPPSPSGPVTARAPAFDFTGRVIDNRYKILRKIGEGGMGTVYAGEHVEIGKGVAVKILHPGYSRQQDLVERFRREARAASRIGHPNIIDVTDFGATEDGCAYFVMEHLDGIDLADVLSHERRVDVSRACQIAIQICRALEAAHAAGVIHRDLKPENIFLVARDGKADFVKVLDFGIARSLTRGSRRLTNPGIAMGTPEYMAPEQAQGGAVDRRSDIYSVGALLYEMVTGAPPHGGATDIAPGARAAPRPARMLMPELSEELERIIMRALDPDPAQRYQTMAQLEYDLTKNLWGRPRAVAELLGLREPEARTEESGAVRERPSDSHERVVGDPVEPSAAATPAPAPAPAAARAVTPVARFSLDGQVPATPTPVPRTRSTPPGAPAPRPEPARFLATFALLTVAAVGAVAGYRWLPWARRDGGAQAAPVPARPVVRPPAAPPPAAEQRARRVQALTAEAQALLEPPAFARLPALEDRLARLRGEGAGAAADRLAARAADGLGRVAAAELDAGDLEAGVSHYKLALGLDPTNPGSAPLLAALRAHGQAALAANRPSEALRWAREAVALADGDADAHGLLAAVLLALGQWSGAAAEYGKALAGRPDDPAFKRGLARAQRRRTAPAPASAPSSAPSSTEVPAPAGEGASDQADPAPPPSAPGEPAPEQ